MEGATLDLKKWTLFLSFIVTLLAEGCDKTKCKGPLRFYDDLKCKPIYEKPDDCCAIRYDCPVIPKNSSDKCFINGQEYRIGEELKNEDRSSPCDIGCYCRDHGNGPAFVCAAVDCFERYNSGCYYKKTIDSCCGQQVCPQSKEHEVKCEVDGETYRDGEAFYPKGYPKLSCVCSEGYKGENVAPFCREVSCGTELRHSMELRDDCTPVFYSDQPPQTSCSLSYRCQNSRDAVVLKKHQLGMPEQPALGVETPDNMKCKFGNLTLAVGDELNQSTDYSSVCVRCLCEVPPTPTCQRLPDNECDVTVHPDFSQSYP
ncbi:hypothetical protein QAD02_004104 [Eretmocerus hayati]|uniref:Uncharacterized protein n=1 Tax=Eretmocerus hayati TaxID=131215 RepID=A0ACC2NR89_9HYME|nr:hypothetical protein QAD02_004104 [Eretmocerus hayati]